MQRDLFISSSVVAVSSRLHEQRQKGIAELEDSLVCSGTVPL